MIRDMEEKYFDDVCRLIHRAVTECIETMPSNQNNIIQDSINSSATWLKTQHKGIHLIYLEQDQVLGTVLVKDYWNMTSLFVLPEAQGKGVGKALVDESVKRCTEKSLSDRIQLNSSTYAAPFYEKMGFVQCGPPHPLPGGCIPYEYRIDCRAGKP